MRGVKHGVVEKYSDQAHFIYELLQNADDAHATSARFILEPDRLIFAHNGSRHFSVSDPSKEDVDTKEGRLGDLNALTSIANSNKTEASIGKFGVGFKAVFQYTSTPSVYDPNFRFKIERFIVPQLLEKDFPERQPDETLFVFPFDHEERTPEQAYEEIAQKLKNLSYPLLFLSDLKLITIKFGEKQGMYGKEITETYQFGSAVAEKICLTQSKGDEPSQENLWLFSEEDDNRRRYSVGFFLKKDGKLAPKDEDYAFCFFPTKARTNLNFIIHAPFLLTDSREGIRAGIPYNEEMVRKLAGLAAKAFVLLKEIGERESTRLIDDSIWQMIPYDPAIYSDPNDKSRISFRPFYDSVKKVFESEEIIPTDDGYAKKENAYWAASRRIVQLFSREQLGKLCGNASACWAFPSIGREGIMHGNNKPLLAYIDSIVKTNLDEDSILRGRSKFYMNSEDDVVGGIDAEFIESQTFSWLHEFYKWLSETKSRRNLIRQAPIFLNQDRKAASAFDKENKAVLFLPAGNMSGLNFVHASLLENQDSKNFIREIGVKAPALRDHIYNNILPLYKNKGTIDPIAHFKLFFEYFCQHSINGDDDEFIHLIKDLELLLFTIDGDDAVACGAANTMYLPKTELKKYFETKPGTRFIALDRYIELVGASEEARLISFLTALGVKDEIDIVRVSTSPYVRDDVPFPKSNGAITWKEGIIVGCKEIVNEIESHRNKEKSILLWNCLLSVVKSCCSRYTTLSDLLKGTCDFYYRSKKTKYFTSSDELLLRRSAWLLDRAGNFVNAENVSVDSLFSLYDTTSFEAKRLIEFLGIVKTTEELEAKNAEDDSNLTDAQRAYIEFAKKILAKYTEEDLEELEKIKERREAKNSRVNLVRSNKDQAKNPASETEDDEGQNESLNEAQKETSASKEKEELDENDLVEENRNGQRNPTSPAKKVVKDIWNRLKEKPSEAFHESIDLDDDFDQDEFTPRSVNYEKRIERSKSKSAFEIDKITCLQELQERLKQYAKYSFGWFKTLLETECLSGAEANSNSREISISFASIERQPGTERTLVLRRPSRYIPQSMEELADVPLVLHMGAKTKTVKIEVASVQSYTLCVKLKEAADLQGVDLTAVDVATIDVQSPAFLLEELRKQFEALGEERGYSDDFNMHNNLCANIEFVFGPPGTGKTTYLAQKEIIPRMNAWNDCKILVLAPTNKAADVLTRKVMESKNSRVSYDYWLVRFGVTGDDEIEKSPVLKEKSFDIRSLNKAVVVTTIARFPYDCFTPNGETLFLRDIKWDYIIFDEASMIPVASVVYPLYKQTPQKFIVAGDPFQIEPVVRVDNWKNENIYALVNLNERNSFVNPQPSPHRYDVIRLTTQYRSVPDIGALFGAFAYGGAIKHSRTAESQRRLAIDERFGIKTFNIVRFPVSKYESVYRPKKLNNSSSYQVYSALFTYEYVRFIAEEIAKANRGERFKIGVIAPYRAQTDLIQKLLANEQIPDEVEVQVDTIHGFQGDECDIVFAVFNTPPKITSSPNMFINKRNIVNVAISRARDYLFVIMPDDETDGIGNAVRINEVEKLIKRSTHWSDTTSSEIERRLFNDPKYLENNTFSTGHQSVNVYGLPEKRYEVRTEDSAVDVQTHKEIPATRSENSSQKKTSKVPQEEFAYVPVNVPVNTKYGSGYQIVQYRLVPYRGKLETRANKKFGIRYVQQNQNGKKRRFTVYLLEEEKLLYIAEDDFKVFDRSKPITLRFAMLN